MSYNYAPRATPTFTKRGGCRKPQKRTQAGTGANRHSVDYVYGFAFATACSSRRVRRVSGSVAVAKHRPASLRTWELSCDQGLATSLQFAVRGDAGTDEILQDPLMYQEAVFPGLLLSRVPAGCRDGVW